MQSLCLLVRGHVIGEWRSEASQTTFLHSDFYVDNSPAALLMALLTISMVTTPVV